MNIRLVSKELCDVLVKNKIAAPILCALACYRRDVGSGRPTQVAAPLR